jgi:hypothetical protein
MAVTGKVLGCPYDCLVMLEVKSRNVKVTVIEPSQILSNQSCHLHPKQLSSKPLIEVR